jgi:hypothetical protein
MLAIAIVALLLPTAARPEDGAGALAAADTSGPALEFRASLFAYSLPDEADYLQPTLAVDRGPLHLESRYQYEDRETFSLFVGWTFDFGEELKLELVPMLGGVAGRTNGIAPGLELSLAWGPLGLYSESEYVVDLEGGTSSFFYAWSELSAWPREWLRFGMALQRTRVFQTARDVSVGPLLGVAVWKLSAAFYLFQPGGDEQSAAASLEASF